MSTELLVQKTNTLKSILEKNKLQFEAALPKHMSVDRLMRVVMTEVHKNPVLLECSMPSVLGAIIVASQLGLEIGSHLGHAYLLPFNNKKKGTKEAQLVVGYKGMIDMAYRSPLVDHVVARPVYDTDKFNYKFGLNETLDHEPDPLCEGTKLTHVYFIVFLKSGGKLFDVMTAREVEMARARSPSPDKGPWVDDYEAMALKSIVRKFSKYTPVSIELQQAAVLDDAADRGEQNNTGLLGGLTLPEVTPENKAKTRTEAFKDALGAAPEGDPEPENNTPTFDDFKKPKAPTIETEAEVHETQADLVPQIYELSEAIGLTLNQLAARAKKAFKKELRDLGIPELKLFRDQLLKDKKA